MEIGSSSAGSARRPYRQGARAAAAEATAVRIIDAFTALLKVRRYGGITLDEVAAGAGVTRQTVIRRFADKLGLMQATARWMGERIEATRYRAAADDPKDAVAVLMRDYEDTGDLLVNILAEEDTAPELSDVLNVGRSGHRRWVEATFSNLLSGLPQEVRARRLIQLVVATDVWIWRLLRRDQKRPAAEVQTLITDMVLQLLISTPSQGGKT